MARKIVLTGGKGGVGKTTCCALLGMGLASLGARVVMLDVDIGLNNLDVVTGIDTRVTYDIVDVAEKKCRVRQALINHPDFPLLYILPSGHSLNVGRVTVEDMQKIILELSASFDYILIDCPAGIGKEFYRAIYLASEAIIVTTPNIVAIRDANKVASLVVGCGISNINIVVNRVRTDLLSRHLVLDPQEIASILGLELLGTIKECDSITIMSNKTGSILGVDNEVKSTFLDIASVIHLGKKQEEARTQKPFGFLKRRRV